MESLAKELSDSNSDKQHLGLLVYLVREWTTLSLYDLPPITWSATEKLWPRLIELLDSYRAQFRDRGTQSDSPENGLSEFLRSGCILYSQCVIFARTHAYTQKNFNIVLEAHYYLTIFLVQCISVQFQQLAKAGDAAHLQHMVLNTCLCWIQVCYPSYMYGMRRNVRYFKSEYKLASVRHV